MMPSHSHLVSPWLMKDLTSGWIRRGGPSLWSGVNIANKWEIPSGTRHGSFSLCPHKI